MKTILNEGACDVGDHFWEQSKGEARTRSEFEIESFQKEGKASFFIFLHAPNDARAAKKKLNA